MKNVALITGASSGIGKELAHIHAAKGGDLILIARRKQTLQSLAEELKQSFGTNSLIIAKDLADPASVKEIYEEIVSQDITVDYLINNAGLGEVGLFAEQQWEINQNLLRVNMMALTELMQRFLPDMVEKRKGKIMNISSTASLIPGPYQATYFASKAYVTSMGYALSEELKNTGITVTTILPGPVDTEFGEVSGMSDTNLFKGYIANPKTVALESYEAMIAGKRKKLVGMSLAMKVGIPFMKFIPTSLILSMVSKMQKPLSQK